MPLNEFDDVDEGEAVLTGAATGAAAGAVGGPIGAVIGGTIGAGIGLFSASSQNEATKKAKQRRDEALFKASVLKDVARKQKQSLRGTGRNLSAAAPKGGTPTAAPSIAAPSGSIGSGISSSGTF